MPVNDGRPANATGLVKVYLRPGGAHSGNAPYQRRPGVYSLCWPHSAGRKVGTRSGKAPRRPFIRRSLRGWL